MWVGVGGVGGMSVNKGSELAWIGEQKSTSITLVNILSLCVNYSEYYTVSLLNRITRNFYLFSHVYSCIIIDTIRIRVRETKSRLWPDL